MMKRLIVIALAGATLTGCANTNTLSGDVYTADQAKEVQQVNYGTIVSVKPVRIQAGNDSNVLGTVGGGVLGGFLGHTIGGGSGQALATAAGAVIGGLAGNKAESVVDRTDGVQLVIRKDDGQTISVVQKSGDRSFIARERVMLTSTGGRVNVSHVN